MSNYQVWLSPVVEHGESLDNTGIYKHAFLEYMSGYQVLG
jgi:hypothetical protein